MAGGELMLPALRHGRESTVYTVLRYTLHILRVRETLRKTPLEWSDARSRGRTGSEDSAAVSQYLQITDHAHKFTSHSEPYQIKYFMLDRRIAKLSRCSLKRLGKVQLPQM